MERNEAETQTLTVLGMTCQACAGTVERALTQIPGVRSAAVSYANATASIQLDSELPAGALARAVGEAGYRLLDESDGLAARVHALRESETREATWLGAEAGLALGGLGALALAHGAGWHAASLDFAIAGIALIAGARTFARGIRALLRVAPDMNTLVMLAAGTALIAAIALRDREALHAGVMILGLVLLGRWLELRTRRRVGTAVEELFDLAPPTARVLRRGVPTDVALSEVRVGNLVQIRPGERIPVDGSVLNGRSEIDASLLTGESAARAVAPGDDVPAGALNGTGALSLRATGVGADSTLERIAQAIHGAQSTRAPIQALADRVAARFVPFVLAVALLGGGLALARGTETRAAVRVVISVLVVACPCALGLATPIALMAGSDRATRAGFLVSDAALFEQLARIDVVVFDKTGTLSRGAPQLERIEVLGALDENEVLVLTAAIEARSEQPLAQAVVDAAQERDLSVPTSSEFEALPGIGVRGVVSGRELVLSRPAEHAQLHDATARLGAEGLTPVVVSVDGEPAALFAFRDPPHERARTVVDELRREQLAIHIMSGDDPRTVACFADELRIADATGALTPEQKGHAVRALEEREQHVLFVGDGINDAPALASASVGLAQGHGADVAIAAADVTWLGRGVPDVAALLALGRETTRTIKQNLAWAFGYNLVALPLASGLLQPWIPWTPPPAIAAFAMAMSSLLVVVNGLRLKHRT